MMSYVGGASMRAAALEYSRQQLGQGKLLSKRLIETVDFGAADIFILAPRPLTSAEALQFNWGHTQHAQASPKHITIGDTPYFAFAKETADAELVEVIYKLLRNPDGLCLLENRLAQAGDPWIQQAKSRVAINGADIYHVLFSEDRDDAKISIAISETDGSPVFVGAVGNSPAVTSSRIRSLHTITTEQLTNFSQTVRCIFIGAYDGEGYLVWTLPEAAVLLA